MVHEQIPVNISTLIKDNMYLQEQCRVTTRNMSTCDLLSVTPAELVVNPRPFRLEGLKPWNCLTPNGHKADKSGQRPYFYLITTNINGHEVVNVDALVLKVSLKVGLGLGGTRPPSFFKKNCVPCRPRPIQEEIWDAFILLKKIFGPTKMRK